jgi:hypothetical protein
MRSRRGHGSRRAVPPRPARRHTMPRPPVIFCSSGATAGGLRVFCSSGATAGGLRVFCSSGATAGGFTRPPGAVRTANLDPFGRSRNAGLVLVPRVAPGRQEGTRAGSALSSRHRRAVTVAAPATVSGEPFVHIGHWETGKAGREATTRKPGDLPAQSPNRWAGRPHGAAVRSGDIVTDAGRARCFSRLQA